MPIGDHLRRMADWFHALGGFRKTSWAETRARLEATVWAAVLNAHATGTPVVYLTRLRGGAFGNDWAWIDAAMDRAVTLVDGIALDIRLVSRR